MVLTRTRPDAGDLLRWAVAGPAGAVEFTVTRTGSRPAVVVHHPAADGCLRLASCDLLPGGTCDDARQMRLPGGGLYRRWAAADCDDTVIWASLQAVYASRTSS